MKSSTLEEPVLSPAPTRRPRALALPDGDHRFLSRRLASLIQAARLEELMPLVVSVAQGFTSAGGGFIALADPLSQDVDLASALDARGGKPRGAIVRDVVSSPSVKARLVRGTHVRHGADGAQDGWLIVPLVSESRLQGALALSFAPPTVPLSRDVEGVRALCRHAAPLVARARETETLHQLLAGLTTLVHEAARCEETLQETRRDRDAAWGLNTRRAHLMGSINHALRTPLVALRGYARLLRDMRGKNATAKENQYLAVISRNVERMVEATRNLWLPTRTRLELADLDLRAVWERARAVVGGKAASRDVRIVAQLPADPVPLEGDLAQLVHMFSELLTHTLDLVPTGQTLQASLADERRGPTLTLAIADGGYTGRTEEEAGAEWRWFDPVREIANLHGGHITTRREPEQGLTFSVVLPRVPSSESGDR